MSRSSARRAFAASLRASREGFEREGATGATGAVVTVPAVSLGDRAKRRTTFASKILFEGLADDRGMALLYPFAGKGGWRTERNVPYRSVAIIPLLGKVRAGAGRADGFKRRLVHALGKHSQGAVPGTAKGDGISLLRPDAIGPLVPLPETMYRPRTDSVPYRPAAPSDFRHHLS